MKIGLVGTFDVANYGDCLFPFVYMHLLQERVDGLEFNYYSPLPKSAGIMDYGPIQALPDTLSNTAFEEDALILCGGETLWIGHSSGTFNFPASTLSAFARLWLAPTVAASRGETKFCVHSVGMPQTHLEAPSAIGDALASATSVSVRDEVTAKRLGNRFPVEVDPVFALSTIFEAHEWKAKALTWLPEEFEPQRYLAAHISAPYLASGLRAWCEQVAIVAKRIEMPILLVPVCHFMDDRNTLTVAREFLVEMGLDETHVSVAPEGSQDIIATAAILGMSGGVITSSLHACVTAASFGVPFATYVGDGKGEGKHRQTLLASGISNGMAMEVSELAATFADSVEQDRKTSQRQVVKRALHGLDRLVASLVNDPASATPLSPATIEAVLFHDTMPTRDLRSEVKRTILRWINKSDFLAAFLAANRRSRIRRGIAQE